MAVARVNWQRCQLDHPRLPHCGGLFHALANRIGGMAESPYQSPQLVKTPMGAWRAFWRRLCLRFTALADVDGMLLVALALWLPRVPAILFAVVNYSTPVLLAVAFVTTVGWMMRAARRIATAQSLRMITLLA